jgi:hypothetical protein
MYGERGGAYLPRVAEEHPPRELPFLGKKGCELRPSFGTGAPAFERTVSEKGGFMILSRPARRAQLLMRIRLSHARNLMRSAQTIASTLGIPRS